MELLHPYRFANITQINESILYLLLFAKRDLPYITWRTVTDRLKLVHKTTHRLSVHKAELTDSDILHRMLRFDNYFTALVGYGQNGRLNAQYNNNINVLDNKGGQSGGDLLPLNFRLPILGWDLYALNQGLSYNLELILFRGPLSPFKTNWQLRDEYKKAVCRLEIAEKLRKRIMIYGILNLILSPAIFMWQILYYFFAYAQSVRNDPGTALGTRVWSPYARVYFRHYNEPEHELKVRLARAYPYSIRFAASFNSRLTILIAKFGAFFSGSLIIAVLVISATIAFTSQAQTQIKNQGNEASALLTLLTLLGIIYGACRSLTGPDPDGDECPLLNVPTQRSSSLQKVLAHVHYLPADWFVSSSAFNKTEDFQRGEIIRDAFCSRFFELKLAHFLLETLSPVLNPWILCKALAPKSLEIVDFFRNYTIEIEGVGDVCSLANGLPPYSPLHNDLKLMKLDQSADSACSCRSDNDNFQSQSSHGNLTRDSYTLSNRPLFPYCPVVDKTKLSLINYLAAGHDNQEINVLDQLSPKKKKPAGDTLGVNNQKRGNNFGGLKESKNEGVNEILDEENNVNENCLMDSLLVMSTLGGGYAMVANDLLVNGQSSFLKNNVLSSICNTYKESSDKIRSANFVRNSLIPQPLLTSLQNFLPDSDMVRRFERNKFIPHGKNTVLPLSVVDMSLTVLFYYNKYSKSTFTTNYHVREQNEFDLDLPKSEYSSLSKLFQTSIQRLIKSSILKTTINHRQGKNNQIWKSNNFGHILSANHNDKNVEVYCDESKGDKEHARKSNKRDDVDESDENYPLLMKSYHPV
ncbi:unnamed protein product [Gordionus sp. m RMFG-2023]